MTPLDLARTLRELDAKCKRGVFASGNALTSFFWQHKDALLEALDVHALVQAKMTSGNAVPVERCTITAAELKASLEQSK